MNKIKVIAVYGCSASGKDTLVNEIFSVNSDFHKVQHWTSRPMRPGEVNGKDYFFLSDKEFTDKANKNEFLMVNYFNNWGYGIDFNSFNPEAINIGVFNTEEMKQLTSDNNFELFAIQTIAQEETLYKRYLSRIDKPFDVESLNEMCRRHKSDIEDLSEIDYITRLIISTDTPTFDIKSYMTGVISTIRILWTN